MALTCCGKVGEPKPPYVRIPEKIRDLAASQSGFDVILSWTNPAHNLDGSNALDPATIHITSNGTKLTDVAATGPGKPQSFSVAAQSWIGQSRTFSVWLETDRRKTSEVATVRAQPVDIPGAVIDIRPVVDQYAITITWNPPAQNTNLANGYFVQRSDLRSAPTLTTEPRFTDRSFNYGKTYTYQIISAREIDSKWISGLASPAVSLVAVDHTPPRIPSGLALVVTDTGGAIVTWDVNEELDLKGYFVYRDSRKLNPAEPQTGNHFFDPDYKPNTIYAISAVDEYGNESPRSAPIS
jgi:hypothetical protein